MNYDQIKKQIKESDDVMLVLNNHEKDYDTALMLFKALENTAKYMTMYLKRKEQDGVELKHAEEELNEYMNKSG